ncbi:efflux RND transporter periplasmic adaptor subunit [Labrys sp. LIt4]|uniref:efflux RND transporter periplasmic adaptor subunit n=1 Tax=Labrys sp. LIt4 TaxID=2821355 RepID=UPI001ADF6ED0|nr:efflux RND transporter periplasmic adaptor subunit [Labrys sp. LIt4]MBP0582129.1 efflux RND transporter periplasmic adaptor subunit [Labrys sp. LIt4]
MNIERERRRRRWPAGLAILMVGLASYAAWRHLAQAAPATEAQAAPAAKVPVTFATAAKADYPVEVEGLGTVSPFKTVTVRSRVDGEITRVFFKQGQMVKQGDALVEIDKRPYQAALDQAIAKKAQDEASLRNDQLNLQRFQNLAQKSFESQQAVDTQQALVDQVKAQIQGDDAAIANARTNLDYTTIKAPFTGRTGFRQIDPGNIVHAADQNGIVTIAQLQPIAVQFTEPQDLLPAIAKAFDHGPAPVVALSSDGQTVLSHGTLAVIDNTVNQATGTISLKARFDNADNALWPGLSVDTRLLVDTLKQVLVVPEDAVQHGPSGLFAYVIGDDGKAVATPIQVSMSGNGRAVVSQGLSAGQKVVVSGQARLQNGAEVEARPLASADGKVAAQAAPQAGTNPTGKAD